MEDNITPGKAMITVVFVFFFLTSAIFFSPGGKRRIPDHIVTKIFLCIAAQGYEDYKVELRAKKWKKDQKRYN